MYKNVLKRVFDIIISVSGLVALTPIFFVIAVLIKREDQGAVFYMGNRIGKDKRKFKMLKFRSMRVNAPDIRNEDGSTFNSNDDLRVTKIGKILRESSLDELPQLINVIKGEMSIIGPRASTWDMLDTYKDDEIDKMKVRPGITGYCQAYYRNSLSAREKRIKDAWYANNVSFILDAKIFIKTIKTIIGKNNLYTN